MSVDVDEVGWAIEPGDDMAPMIEVVGGVIKFHREAAGMSVADFGAAMRYGEDLIRKVERGARIPRVEFLYSADELVNARGAIVAMRKYVEDAQYPKKVRALKELEARAVEMLLYSNHNIHGLLQTPEFAKALFEMTQPPLTREVIERETAARMARKSVFIMDGASRVDVELVRRELMAAKVTRAKVDVVRETTGYAIGGVPPFGHRTRTRVLADRSLLEHDIVWAAAGTPYTVFPMEPKALITHAGATLVDVRESAAS